MPNWCSNVLYISHADPSMIDKIVDADREHLFETFFPCPQELRVEAQIGLKDDELSPEVREMYASNREKYGASHWYDWCWGNWGTKWDAAEVDCERISPNKALLHFDTAWGSPVIWYDKMMKLGYIIRAYYSEPNMAFCGIHTNLANDHYEYESSDEIPQEIINEFPWLGSNSEDYIED